MRVDFRINIVVMRTAALYWGCWPGLRATDKAGIGIPMSRAMMAITTNSPIKVKAFLMVSIL